MAKKSHKKLPEGKQNNGRTGPQIKGGGGSGRLPEAETQKKKRGEEKKEMGRGKSKNEKSEGGQAENRKELWSAAGGKKFFSEKWVETKTRLGWEEKTLNEEKVSSKSKKSLRRV